MLSPFFKSATMRKLFAIISFIVCFSGIANAQGERIFLFDNFAQGGVYFKNGAVNAALMNYDANNGKMYFQQGGELMELMGVAAIDSIKFGDRKFIQLQGDFIEPFKTEHGTISIQWRIHKIHQGYEGAYGLTTQSGGAKKIQLPSNFGMGTFTTSGGGGMYNGTFGVNDAHEGGRNFDVWKMQTSCIYHFAKDGKIYKVKRTKDLLKAFPDKKEEIKRYATENSLDMLSADKALQLIDYALSL